MNSLVTKNKQFQNATQISDEISYSVLYTLGRKYLDIPLSEANFIQVDPKANLSTEPCHFVCLEQVGESTISSIQNHFISLQTALSACHDPGKYTLVFVVASDGTTNRIYLGMRGHSSSDRSLNRLSYLSNFLKGNCPGIRLRECKHSEIQRQIQVPISSHAIALTGIPSLKLDQNGGQTQSLDRLLRGLLGKSFLYMIIAEPVSAMEVDQISYQCRELTSKVHALTKATINETQTEGNFTNTGQVNPDLSSNLMIGGSGLASFFPPAALLSALAAGGTLLSGGKFNQQTTDGTGFNRSIAKALGKEHINVHAQVAEAHLQRYMTRFDAARTLGCWNVGVYFIAEDTDIAQQGGYQLRALLSGEKSAFEPIRIHSLERIWMSGVQSALSSFEQPNIALVNPRSQQKIEHPLSNIFNGLTTPLNNEELSLLVNLPQREVPGVKVIPTADFSLNPQSVDQQDMILGNLLEGGEPTPLKYGISLTTLAKHALITGITGSGKSTSTRRILREMQHRRIPFLVVEPAKSEYVDWAMSVNQNLAEDDPNRIIIYMPGTKIWRGQALDHQLTLNPFDIVRLSADVVPQVLPHIDRLKSILNASFPMQEILPVLLEELVFHAYTRPRNWLDDQLLSLDTPCPTLTQIFDQIHPVVKSKGYAQEVTNNLSAALTTRIQSLRRGWKGQLFDQPKSTAWADIFDRPVVINLSYLGDDSDKALAIAILLQFLYEYRQAQHELGLKAQHQNHSLTHLAVIEEAHRILLRTGTSPVEQANPQGKVAEMFSNLISEIRAYGQGILLVDQVPGRLVPDAIKNTNLKIVHRLVAEDDRDAMSGCMSLTPEQSAIINRLRPGQAIAFGDLDDKAAWVQVATN